MGRPQNTHQERVQRNGDFSRNSGSTERWVKPMKQSLPPPEIVGGAPVPGNPPQVPAISSALVRAAVGILKCQGHVAGAGKTAGNQVLLQFEKDHHAAARVICRMRAIDRSRLQWQLKMYQNDLCETTFRNERSHNEAKTMFVLF